MKRIDFTTIILLVLFFCLSSLVSCAGSEEEPGTDGDTTDNTCAIGSECMNDSDCPGDNDTCNTVGGCVCVEHGACTADANCDAWFGVAKPFCNEGGICELYCDHCDNPSDGDVIEPTDGDDPVDCNDFSGLYDGTYDCGGSSDVFDTWIASNTEACLIYIRYEDELLSGTVDGADISLKQGKKCSGEGLANGDITLSCQDGCEITLTPKADDPEAKGVIRVQPTLLDFGADTVVNSSTPRTTQVTNEGEGGFTIHSILITQEESDEFVIQNLDSDWVTPKTFEYGGHAEMTVIYTPKEEAARREFIYLFTDASNQAVIQLTLVSSVKASPEVVTDPPAVDFGASPPGYDNPRYFLIKNIGEASAQITNIRFDDTEGNNGDADGAYTMELSEDSTPPFWIDALSSAAVNMNFKPIDGVHAIPSNVIGRLCIDWKDRLENDVSTCVDLLASVSELQPACISAQPLEGVPGIWGLGEMPGPGLKFGYRQLDAFHHRELEICNCGDLPMELSNFMWNELLTGPPLTYRAFAEEPGSFTSYTVNRSQCIYIPISYYPDVEGAMNTAALQFNTNAETFEWLGGPQPPDTPAEWQGVVLAGVSGIGARRGIEVLPTKLDFGLITLDCCSRPQELTIYNVGDLELAIADIAIGAGSDNKFELLNLPSANEYPVLLGGDGNPQRLRFKVKFCPTFEGMHNGRVEITNNDENASQMIVPLQGEGTLLTHQKDVFEQPCRPMVDILWVIDCSGSMNEEQGKLSDNIRDFINEAVTWDASLHIAVTSTDVISENVEGGSGMFHGNPAVLDTESMSDNEVVSKFKNYATGLRACAGEESGLEAGHLALSEPLISNENVGFLRDDAKLSIIFVSDEPDQSVADVPFFIDFFRSIKGMRNTNMIEVYAIVGDKPNGCSAGDDGDAAAGPRYISVADACNPYDDEHFMSICEDSYAPIYDNLAQNLFALPTQFFLSRLADVDTLVVTVNGQLRNDYEYDETSNSIIFPADNAPPACANITAEYDTICLH